MVTLFSTARTKDNRARIWILGYPSQRQLSNLTSQLLFGKLGEYADLLNLGLTLRSLQCRDTILEEVGMMGIARILWYSLVIFARKHTASECRECGRANVVLLIQGTV